MEELEIDDLLQDSRVIRNRRKLMAIVHNARMLIELDTKHGSFQNYLRLHLDFYALLKDIRKRFKFLGDMGVFYWLYVVNEPVPNYEEFTAHIDSGKPKSR